MSQFECCEIIAPGKSLLVKPVPLPDQLPVYTNMESTPSPTKIKSVTRGSIHQNFKVWMRGSKDM